jgi:hypothetical protein
VLFSERKALIKISKFWRRGDRAIAALLYKSVSQLIHCRESPHEKKSTDRGYYVEGR